MKIPKPKLDAEIVFPNGDSILIKKRKIDQNTIVIESGSKGRGNEGWKPTFTKDSVVTVKRGRILKRSRKKVIVQLGADSCLDFYGAGKDATAKVPTITPEGVEKLFEAKVLKTAGMSAVNVKVPWYVTAILVALFMLSVLDFAISRGLINVR